MTIHYDDTIPNQHDESFARDLAKLGAQTFNGSAPIVRTIRPLAGRVYVKPVPPKTTSAGGIIIPESAQEQLPEALVIASGVDTIKIGDVIVHEKYAGQKVDLGDIACLVLKEEDVLCAVGGAP